MKWVAAVTGAVALLLAGCAAPVLPETGRTTVLAAFYPLQFVVEQVGGEHVAVASLTPPGVEPHDVELSARQVAAIADADLVVYLKGFQPAVDEAVAQQAADHALDVTAVVPLLPSEGHEGETEDAHSDHAGDSTTADLHVWLDPTNMVRIGRAVAERLTGLAPGQPASFAADEDRLTTRLRALDREWARGTRSCRSRDLVVSHEAFAYLAHRYHFTQVGIAGLSAEAEPNPATVAAVADFARARGVTTVYYETLVDPAVAQTVADEIGVVTAVLDPIEGVEPGSAGTYLSLMRANLAAVRTGQGCR